MTVVVAIFVDTPPGIVAVRYAHTVTLAVYQTINYFLHITLSQDWRCHIVSLFMAYGDVGCYHN